MKRQINRTIKKWSRNLHRDIGYLVVGISLVYGISGMYLNHMDGKDPSYTTQSGTITLPAHLSTKALKNELNSGEYPLPKVTLTMPQDAEHLQVLMEGGVGFYNKESGIVDYQTHQKKWVAYVVNKLHYNQVKGWRFFADLFAIALIFLALSGLFMVSGKKGVAGRGKWLLTIGIVIPILFFFLI